MQRTQFSILLVLGLLVAAQARRSHSDYDDDEDGTTCNGNFAQCEFNCRRSTLDCVNQCCMGGKIAAPASKSFPTCNATQLTFLFVCVDPPQVITKTIGGGGTASFFVQGAQGGGPNGGTGAHLSRSDIINTGSFFTTQVGCQPRRGTGGSGFGKGGDGGVGGMNYGRTVVPGPDSTTGWGGGGSSSLQFQGGTLFVAGGGGGSGGSPNSTFYAGGTGGADNGASGQPVPPTNDIEGSQGGAGGTATAPASGGMNSQNVLLNGLPATSRQGGNGGSGPTGGGGGGGGAGAPTSAGGGGGSASTGLGGGGGGGSSTDADPGDSGFRGDGFVLVCYTPSQISNAA